MYRVAVLGDRDSTYGFGALGLTVFPVEEEEEAKRVLKELLKEDYAIIYITEYYASKLSSLLDSHKNIALPVILPIPGIAGNTKNGVTRIKKMVEQAVGSDIIFREEM
ncbi:V-type ATP synthase subunit F [Lachnoclostridium phytofermentans]|uniref:V-type ATP synthase subunit F n=1 Tax=Lachnoclostridium phytofermentans TaxID=66219 RepID=UPI0004984D40|nr:V-type ATP synthase subunit F [Lachnoclostridium phytofermentans]